VYNEMRATLDHRPNPLRGGTSEPDGQRSLIDIFKASLEAVDGNCLVVDSQAAATDAIKGVIQQLGPGKQRIALSDAPLIASLKQQLENDVDEIVVTPDASSLFDFDIGISAVQGAIAETGTLVLQSDRERNRLISLVPPVHIAIVDCGQLCLTLGQALAALYRDEVELSPSITFITGPSRTADIELTLAIGVHGPKKLFVIVIANA
jgi:L-lactate dehydrogenase complex protein LldG